MKKISNFFKSKINLLKEQTKSTKENATYDYLEVVKKQNKKRRGK